MARDLSLNFREAINAEASGAVPIFLVTITHPQLVDPIRVSTDPTERVSDAPLIYKTVSRGQDFIFVPMSVVLPEEREGSPPRSQLQVSNVTPAIVALVRSVTTPPKAKLEMVLASPIIEEGEVVGYDGLDDVEIESPLMDVISVDNQAGQLSLDLVLNSLATELAPTDSFDPSRFASLFG